MIRVALLTSAYPYLPGEQFLEEEVRYWARRAEVELVVMPMSASGEPRALPPNVRLELGLVGDRRGAALAGGLAMASARPVLWRELLSVLRTRGPSAFCLAKACHATAMMLLARRRLRSVLASQGPFDLVYCYWNDTASLGAAMLRREGQIPRLVSRIHGYELYEEQVSGNYIPLKHQFIADFDCIYPVSGRGRAHLVQRFGAQPARVVVARLGVEMPVSRTATSASGVLRVLSIGQCVPIKRIDVIIQALARLARLLPGLGICWTHLGDGPLLPALRVQAEEALGPNGVSWEMPGELPHAELGRYLATHPADVLVNASASEGVPVSIMEAMSHGIPAIAPDVGGVAELVSNDCGRLLPPAFGPEQLARALFAALVPVKQERLRRAAREKVDRDFNAALNYTRFADELLRQARPPGARPACALLSSPWNQARL